ncbi:hypothetical protein CCACVL1_12755 [Corchorus capsularis]|uniref:Bifunctional inhibitor/plant lipid transfer protein/seed storage helical domain-containing protein n=1 Tax=Corchorus capsularis TaxID=210143 RepID=A0A1R3IDV6_COCAP|nr:hypothetical protein CCACVL1_12755 [Corchorus capsularis]
MELSKLSSYLVPLVLVIALSASVNAQITTPCNPSMLSSFTPCMNFLTNSSGNGTSPTADCCNSLKNLTNGGLDCLCLIVTGSVPFQLPINRTLAISLPQACNMPSVPVKCKGPTSLAPTLSPGASPTLSPSGPIVPEPTPSAQSPESDTTPTLTPPSSTVGSEAPTATTGSRPVLTPSAANPSYSFAPFFVVLALGFLIFKHY